MNRFCAHVLRFFSSSKLLIFSAVLFLPSISSAMVSYEYDARHRLISFLSTDGIKIVYSYDDAGNRIKKNASTSINPNSPPETPGFILPQDNSENVESLAQQLRWTGGDPDSDSIVTYSLFFGETEEPALLQDGLETTTFDLPLLKPDTQYYWKVIARDQYNLTAEGAVWKFSTDSNAQYKPIDPFPANGSILSYENVNLAWFTEPVPGVTLSYDIYFGTSATPPLVQIDSAQAGYQAGTLAPGTTYYWQVVTKDDRGLATVGPLWTFSTSSHAIQILANSTFSTDTTLTKSGGPYVISGQLSVSAGTVLTIEPGTEFKMQRNASIRVDGTLLAIGTDIDRILFTSYKNDLAGGDTNQDGNSTTPAPGDWAGIVINNASSNTSHLEYCVVEYGGSSNYAAIKVYSSSPSIRNTIIRHSKYYGLYVQNGSPVIANNTISDSGNNGIYVRGGFPTIDTNVIENSGKFGIYIVSGSPTVTNSTIENGIFAPNNGLSQLSNNTISLDNTHPLRIPVDSVGGLFSGNTLSNVNSDSYIEVVGGIIARDAVWKGNVPLHILGSITVKGTDGDDNLTTLTLKPGVELKFGLYQQLIIGGASGDPGALQAIGTAEKKIRFTSSAATSEPGKWYGITFSTTAADSSSMEHCIIEYAGSGNYAAVITQNSSLTVKNTLIQNNKYYGIQIRKGSPVLDGNIIRDNGYYGIYVLSGTPTVINNTVYDGVFFQTNGLSRLHNNTFFLGSSRPLHLPADFIGELFSDNTLSNINSDSYIEVVGGTITRDAIWKDTVPLHFLGSITVRGTDGDDNLTTLTLKPGMELKFGLYQQLIIGGTSGDPGALQAIGTVEKQIRFTSSAATSGPGKWYGITLNPTSDNTSVVAHSIVEYAGAGNYGAIYTNNASPTLKNNIIRDNKYYGIKNNRGSPVISDNLVTNNGHYSIFSSSGTISLVGNTVDGGLSIPNNGLTSISGNTFIYDNDFPVKLPAEYVGWLTQANIFTNTDSGSAIEVLAGTVTLDAMWKDKLPLHILGSISVRGTDGDDSFTTLTLEPGLELLFDRYARFTIGGTSGAPGSLVAIGTPEKKIRFSSYLASPAPGNWYGLTINPTSYASTILEFCDIEYAGAGNYGAIYINNASPTITKSVIRNNQYYGIKVYLGTPRIMDSIFTGNGADAIYSQSAEPGISGNSFMTNNGCGVKNITTSIVVSAEDNWWNHTSGPLDSSNDTATGGLYNPSAQGVCVSDYVDYEPWITVNISDIDGDGIFDLDELTIYGSDPLLTDTDGDGITDGDELAYWGEAWNGDVDNDGLINLLDADSDNDGINDGDEMVQPIVQDSSLPPATIVYEDAEDGLTTGWSIYDADPSGAFVDNVYDIDKNSRAIELNGDGLQNGFLLQDELDSEWQNTDHQVIQWRMRYSNDFVISIAAQTTGGLRYLSYTPDDFDALGLDTNVFHGLGLESKDGTWRTYTFDLGFHLNEAQPGNRIISLLGFYVSGNGLVDDIKTRQTIPPLLDSDGDGISDIEEITIYTTHPYDADSDDDGLNDGAELSSWGSAWNSDADGDGLINILDIDSDNDGINDFPE